MFEKKTASLGGASAPPCQINALGGSQMGSTAVVESCAIVVCLTMFSSLFDFCFVWLETKMSKKKEIDFQVLNQTNQISNISRNNICRKKGPGPNYK